MKLNFKLLAPVLGLLALVWWGCETKVPPIGPFGAYPPPNLTANHSMVVSCDGDILGVPVKSPNINPNLFEVGTPGNILKVAGAATLVNNFKNNVAVTTLVSGAPFQNIVNMNPDGAGTIPVTYTQFPLVDGPGANGTPWAIHATGVVIEPGQGKYPAFDLQIQMENAGIYDMSFFTGVKFYLKLGAADTAVKRTFSIPIAGTQAPPQGFCASSCYDHFAFAYTNTTAGQWKQFSIEFATLTREGWGSAVNPPTLTGSNLKQVLWLQWEEGNSNTAGRAEIDFWVDQIEFY